MGNERIWSSDIVAIKDLEVRLITQLQGYVESNVAEPYASIVSGGFDSSFMTAVTNPSKVFRVKIPYDGFDESKYAYAVLDHLELWNKYTEIVLTPELYREHFANAVRTMGETTRHFSLVPFYILMKTISESGIKDVLSGEGPDEYLGGYPRQIIWDEIRKIRLIPELAEYGPTVDKVLDKELVKGYAKMMGYSSVEAERYQTLYDSGEYQLQGAIGMMDMDIGGIELMEQRMANHFGIRLHYPYINNELAEICYKLPDHYKIRGGVTKWIFRQICKKYLPEIVIGRHKMGGPVAPVNMFMGWDVGPYDKTEYIKAQEKILYG
jgi:asparagine synthase (glutamine-hydrolysing)